MAEPQHIGPSFAMRVGSHLILNGQFLTKEWSSYQQQLPYHPTRCCQWTMFCSKRSLWVSQCQTWASKLDAYQARQLLPGRSDQKGTGLRNGYPCKIWEWQPPSGSRSRSSQVSVSTPVNTWLELRVWRDPGQGSIICNTMVQQSARLMSTSSDPAFHHDDFDVGSASMLAEGSHRVNWASSPTRHTLFPSFQTPEQKLNLLDAYA